MPSAGRARGEGSWAPLAPARRRHSASTACSCSRRRREQGLAVDGGQAHVDDTGDEVIVGLASPWTALGRTRGRPRGRPRTAGRARRRLLVTNRARSRSDRDRGPRRTPRPRGRPAFRFDALGSWPPPSSCPHGHTTAYDERPRADRSPALVRSERIRSAARGRPDVDPADRPARRRCGGPPVAHGRARSPRSHPAAGGYRPRCSRG